MGEKVTNSQILHKVSVVEADVAHIKTTTDAMHEVIHGNGDPKKGVTSRVTVVETIVERLERMFWLVAGAAVAAVVGAVFAIFRSS
jgi:hypothetical protein